MSWLAALLLRVGELGPWGLILFALLYVAAAVMMAPAFVLSVAAGALFGVWKGSLLVFVSATLGASALTVDVGSWYRSQRDLQAQADSAALAGAQPQRSLPYLLLGGCRSWLVLAR